jgi:hypothetical protein
MRLLRCWASEHQHVVRIYLIGYIIFIVGLAIGAHMHMPPRWIGVGVTILVGLESSQA